MKTFVKAQTASLAATLADFCITILCAELLHINVVASAAIGNVGGAIVNFMMGRKWVFVSDEKGIGAQALKYAVVWFGYMALATFGIYVLENYTPLHYIFSKILVGITLAATYNYFLQKKFVFN